MSYVAKLSLSLVSYVIGVGTSVRQRTGGQAATLSDRSAALC